MAVIIRQERVINGTPLVLQVYRPAGRLTKADREQAERLDAELATRIPKLAQEVTEQHGGASLIRQRWLIGRGLREIVDDRTLVKKSDLAKGHVWEAIWHYLPPELRPTGSANEESYADREERRKGFFSLCYEISGYEWSEIDWIERWTDWYEVASRPGLTRDRRVLRALAGEIRSLHEYPSGAQFQQIVKSLASSFPTLRLRDSSLLEDRDITKAVATAVGDARE